MAVALVGVLGVILGALLTGLVAAQLERRRRKRVAFGASRVIQAELNHAIVAMESAADKGEWWKGPLPTKWWDAHANELVLEADDDLWASATSAYHIIDTYNLPRDMSEGKLGEKTKTDLAERAERLKMVQRKLKSMHTRLEKERSPTRLVLSMSAIAAALIVILGLAQYPDITPNTVAGVLQEEVGKDALVECDPDGEDWQCTINQLDQTRDNCTISSSAAIALAGAAIPQSMTQFHFEASSELGRALPGCSTLGQPFDIDGSLAVDESRITFREKSAPESASVATSAPAPATPAPAATSDPATSAPATTQSTTNSGGTSTSSSAPVDQMNPTTEEMLARFDAGLVLDRDAPTASGFELLWNRIRGR